MSFFKHKSLKKSSLKNIPSLRKLPKSLVFIEAYNIYPKRSSHPCLAVVPNFPDKL